MKNTTLDHPEFQAFLRTIAEEGPTGHGAIIAADWLDDHDDHVRAHIFRHGVQSTIGTVPDDWRDAGQPAHHVHLRDNDRPRFLRGEAGFVGEPDRPVSSLQNGPERFDLFHAHDPSGLRAYRHIVRYTNSGVTLHAPLPSGALRAIGDAWIKRWHADNPDYAQEPWNHWHSAADHTKWHEDREHESATHLARVKVAPGTPYGQPFGGGSAIVSHDVHDEAGKRLGVVRVQERNDGNMLHVHWTEGQFGPEGVRGVMEGLAGHYPNAEFVSGWRGHGTEGQTGFRRPSQRTLVVKPLRPTKMARPDEANYNALVAALRKSQNDYALRENKQPTDRPDQTPSLAFSDWLEENGVPGWNVVRMHANDPSPHTTPLARMQTAFGRGDTRRASPIVSIEDNPHVLLGTSHRKPDGTTDPDASASNFMKRAGEAPLAQIHWSRTGGRGAFVLVLHHESGGKRIVHAAHVKTPDELRAAVSEFPQATKAALLNTEGNPELAHAMRGALKGKGSRNVKLARMQAAPGGNPTIVNNMAYRPGQFIAKARQRIRDVAAKLVKLARRPDDADYDALIHGVRNTQGAGTTERAVLADWLQEHGIPGAHIVRARANSPETTAERNRSRTVIGTRNVVNTPQIGLSEEAPALTPAPRFAPMADRLQHKQDTHASTGLAAVASLSYAKNRGGLMLIVHHQSSTGSRVSSLVHVKTAAELLHLVSDFPQAAKVALLQPLIDNSTLKRVLTGRGKSAVKLAREPAPFTADTSARGLFGRSPHDEAEERPLTLGELKDIEAEHKLPEHHLLSPHVYQSPDAKGDEHPYTASNEDIRWFIHNVSRAALPEPRVRALLADKKLPTGAKLTHLIANMKADYEAAHKGADGSGGSWYEGQINELERHLHSAAAGGKDHPLWGSMGKDGELVGKHAPEENHPGVVLFKALLSATSGAQNPVDNTLSAARAWAAGRRRGHPILDMPTYNEDSKEEWLNKARKLNHITPTDYEREAHLRNPGTTQEQRARWYNTFVKPHAGELDSEMDGKPVGYTASEARVNPDHTVVWEQDGGGNKVRHGGKDERGTSFAAKLPLVHPDGSLKTKGWGARGEQAASGISSLKALFHVAKAENPQMTEAEQFRWVARWLLHDHGPEDFAHVADTLKRLGVNLPDLGANTFDYKKHGQQGWFTKGERVPGMFVLGPKFGAFGMNLNSNSPHVAAKYRRFLTADMWFSRNWARYLGQMFRGKKRKPTETPTANDRRQMAVAIHKLCTDLGVHPADLQADLWYHEQSLYRMLGQDAKRTVSVSYADAARKWLDKNSPHALRDRDGKLIRLAKRKPKPIQHTWETIPHTDPELQSFWGSVGDSWKPDFTAVSAMQDWLTQRNDWRHHIAAGIHSTHVAAGKHDWLESRMGETRPSAALGGSPLVLHGPNSEAYSTVAPVAGGVHIRTYHPSRNGRTLVSSFHTHPEYEAMRRDAATAGVHFPKVS